MSDNAKPDNPHDTRLKELFRNRDAFYSLLKDCVKADWINDLDSLAARREPLFRRICTANARHYAEYV